MKERPGLEKMAAKKKTTKKTAKTTKKAAKKTSKKATKKVTKKTSKKAVKKVTKKVGKKTSKKTVKKATKKASQKIAKKGSSTKPSAASFVGKKAPAFELQDQNGKVVSSASLKGKPYVLYFYPKDNTPGCTRESCEFRDDQRNFQRAGVTILGVSPDSVKSHAGFAAKFSLPFTLLSDPEKTLAKAYGTWALKKNYGREYWGIVRSTFLVDENGKVAKEWRNVKVNGHVPAVLAEARG